MKAVECYRDMFKIIEEEHFVFEKEEICSFYLKTLSFFAKSLINLNLLEEAKTYLD